MPSQLMCARCKKSLSVDAFSVDASRRSGRNTQCRKCFNDGRRGKGSRAHLPREKRRNQPPFVKGVTLTKICTKCRVDKNVEEYTLKSGIPLPRCKACVVEYESIKSSDPAVVARVKKQQFKARLKYAFGMSLEDWDAMLRLQGGGCAICGVMTDPVYSRLCVDHDHGTGKVRGLLCFNCNVGIARFMESPDLFRRAIAYLIAHGAKP